MREEKALRLPGFRLGAMVRFADGQERMLSAPPEASEEPEDVGFGPDYQAMLIAILEAEGESEQRLAELCLTIYLLGRNYALDPEDFQSLLEQPPDDPTRTTLQAAIREIASLHVHSFLVRTRRPASARVHSPAILARSGAIH